MQTNLHRQSRFLVAWRSGAARFKGKYKGTPMVHQKVVGNDLCGGRGFTVVGMHRKVSNCVL